jgi:hypothetical protein
MAGKQAKVLSEQEVEDLLFFAKTTRNPDRNRVKRTNGVALRPFDADFAASR